MVEPSDAAGITGMTVNMPNSEWGSRYDDGGKTTAVVVGLVDGGSDDGSDAYVVEAQGHLYIFGAAATIRAASITGGAARDGD